MDNVEYNSYSVHTFGLVVISRVVIILGIRVEYYCIAVSTIFDR